SPLRQGKRLDGECRPGSEFARRVGYDFVVEDAPLRVVVKIAREKGALASSLSLYDSAGKQLWTKPATFPAWQCLTLVQAMAGLLAVRFDPLVFRPAVVEAPTLPPPPPKPEPEPEPEPEPKPAPPPCPVTAPPPAPPKRAFRLVGGLDGVFTSYIPPSATAGVALWAGVDLADLPLSFELDLRLTRSLIPVDVRNADQPHAAVRSSYISGVLAGCWHWSISVCPVLEIGSVSFSEVGSVGRTFDHSAVVAVGVRGAHKWHLGERFFVRGLVEGELVLKRASLLGQPSPGEAGQPLLTPSLFSLSVGLGFGGSL
ncbi:MAG: hypothetical protein ACMG6S_27915, partial [Byssovorax sp.]